MELITKLIHLSTNKSLRNGALFSIFSFINRGIGFFLLLILAKYIGPKEYGYLSLFTTVVMVIGYFICFSSEGYMSVSYFKEPHEEFRKTCSVIISLGVCMLCVFNLILAIGGNVIAQVSNLPLSILFIAVMIAFMTSMTNINLDYFRIQQNIKKYGLFSCSNAVLNFLLSIFLIKYCILSWQGRVYAQCACYSLFGIYSIYFFASKKLLTRNIKDKLKPILIWSIPLIPHLATSFIRQGCDRYIINYTHSISDVGLFSFALNLANIIAMVGMGFNQSNSVEIYKTLGDKERSRESKLHYIRKSSKMFLALYLASAIVITAICYALVPIILPKYEMAGNYTLILSIYGFLQCVYLVYCNYLFFYGKTRNLMYITFFSAILHLLLSLILTRFSLYYTCMIYCFTQLVVALLVRYEAKKSIKENLISNK